MTRLEIRQADLADVPALSALRDGDPDGPADPRMSRYLAGVHHPGGALAPRVMLMAVREGEPVGYVAGHLTRRFDCDGELQYLYLRPEHRGVGVADAMLNELARWFAVRGAPRVCVDAGNPRAERFYARLGAVPLHGPWWVWPDITVLLDPA